VRKFLLTLLAVCMMALPVYADFPGAPPSGPTVGPGYDVDEDNLIDADKGGTELDTSASTGVPYIESGTWSVLNYGTANYCLQMNSGGDGLEWGSCGGGDITGPGSSTSGAVAVWSGTGGDTLASTTYVITSTGGSLIDDGSVSAMRGTLGLGSIATQAASGVAITGGTASGVTISSSPISGSTGSFTTGGYSSGQTNTGTTTFSDETIHKEGTQAYFGETTTTRYGIYRENTNQQLIFSTQQTGATMSDSNAIYQFMVANGYTTDTGQTLFKVQDDSTTYFKVDESGIGYFDGEVQGTSFASHSASDGDYYINVSNSSTMTSPSSGDCYFDKTANAWKCYDDSTTYSWGGTVPSGTDPTVASAGAVGIDTTADQFVYYGTSSAVAIEPVQLSTPYQDWSPAVDDNLQILYTDRPITITFIHAVNLGGSSPSVTWRAYHSTDRSSGTGGTGVMSGTKVTTSETTGDKITTGTSPSLSDPTIPADSYVYIYVSAVGSQPDGVIFSMGYTVDRQ
jgi:hypothetical protein